VKAWEWNPFIRGQNLYGHTAEGNSSGAWLAYEPTENGNGLYYKCKDLSGIDIVAGVFRYLLEQAVSIPTFNVLEVSSRFLTNTLEYMWCRTLQK